MTTIYQMQEIATKKVTTIGRQMECLLLCSRANTLAGKPVFEVVRATLENIAKSESFKPNGVIYTADSFSDFDRELSGESDFPSIVEVETISTKERVKNYLLKCSETVKKTKKQSNKKLHARNSRHRK